MARRSGYTSQQPRATGPGDVDRLRREVELGLSSLALAIAGLTSSTGAAAAGLGDDVAALADAEVVLMSADADFPAHRVLTGSTHIEVDDGGAAGPVTLNLIQNTSRLLGRTTAGAGATEEISVASPITLSALTLDFDETVPLGNNARVNVQIADVSIGTRRAINFLAGAGMQITGVDDGAGEEVDLTLQTVGVASVDAAYVTIGNDGSLTAERALTGSTSILVTDNGANSSVVLSLIDEYAQDLVGAMLADSTSIDFSYDDGAGTFTANVIESALLPDGAEALATAVPITLTIGGALAAGTANSFARADHHHSVSMNTNRMLGRLTAAFGLVEELTAAQVGGWLVGGVVDHGGLGGLGDDDHTQYLLASGTRALTGDWDSGAPNVTHGGNLTLDAATPVLARGTGGGSPNDYWNKADAAEAFCYWYNVGVPRWLFPYFRSTEALEGTRLTSGGVGLSTFIGWNATDAVASTTTTLYDATIAHSYSSVLSTFGDDTGSPEIRRRKTAAGTTRDSWHSGAAEVWGLLFDTDESWSFVRTGVNTPLHFTAASQITTLADAAVTLSHADAVLKIGDGLGGPQDLRQKADASTAYSGFRKGASDWWLWEFATDEALALQRRQAGFVNYPLYFTDAASAAAAATVMGDRTINMSETSIALTLGAGTGSPGETIDADGTGTGTLTFLKDSANTSGKRLQHTTGEDLNFESHNGSAWLEVASIENSDHTWQFNRQWYATPTTYAPSGTTQTIDWNEGNMVWLGLFDATGDVTLTLSNPRDGAIYHIRVLEGVAERDLIWPASVEWPGGIAPVITAGDGSVDLIKLVYDDALGSYYGTFAQNFS